MQVVHAPGHARWLAGWVTASLAASAGCGDNQPSCGHVRVLEEYRNIWPGQIAVDAERVYFSDYDNGAGTHLVFRVPRDGGQPLVIAARGESQRFGDGMAVHDTTVYWTGENEPTGYNLIATPVLGGRSEPLVELSPCSARGVAVDEVAAYAGTIRCADTPAHVAAVPFDGSGARQVWSSSNADVAALAAFAGTVFVATTAGLYRVTTAETELLDGHPTHHVVIDGDDLVYSTDEQILARPLVGGTPRTLYTFRTPIGEPRAFASDSGDLYIAEPPSLVFVPRGGAPQPLVRDIGATVTHVVAKDGAAYWATSAVPESLGIEGTFSGAVLRVDRPCE